MEENKINETEIETDNVEIEVQEKTESPKKLPKPKKEKKIKNQFLLKKGTYSVAITAIVLAGIIVLNILVGVLSKRFVLEYDFSSDKKTSLSEKNIDYVKSLKNDIDVTVCAAEDTYANYMTYYAQQYNVASGGEDYYDQTIKILNKYANYNGKINLKFVDPQSTDFSSIKSDFATENLAYGDIIVSSKKGENERHKIVKYTDVYTLQDDQTYAAYGYTTSTVSGNNIENALTGAISYVSSEKTKKIAFLTGHSSSDVTADYKTLLSNNNYEIVDVKEKMITSISSEYDSIVIAAPTTDFLADEIKAISEYLDNDSKLGKGLIFFADASCPYLTNLYDFLEGWGISAEEGVLFETADGNHVADDPTTMVSINTEKDDITANMQYCVSSSNVPLVASFDKRDDLTVNPLMATAESDIAAPKGSGATFGDADKYEKKSYATAIMSSKLDYLDGTNEVHSYVCAFSSTSFLSSMYNESSSVSNKNLTLAVAERLCGADKNDFSFVPKNIENVSFAESVTESSSNLISLLFVGILPLAMMISGIAIFIKRRNS